MGGWALHPGQQIPVPREAGEIARVEERRAMRLDRDAPPRVAQEVDHRERSAAAWWPREEPPVIAGHVAAGRLPPVAERTGPEPIVLEGETVGHPGGTLHRLIASERDMPQIYNRLSSANLVRWSPQGYPIVPHLAKAWEVSDDHRVFIFKLRQGMRWSDGHPVSAHDLGYWL